MATASMADTASAGLRSSGRPVTRAPIALVACVLAIGLSMTVGLTCIRILPAHPPD
jgi:hypothetical protein